MLIGGPLTTTQSQSQVIEPVLKVHRAYRFAIKAPQCDQYVLCEVNSHNPKDQSNLASFKAGITRFSSMGAAWFIGNESGTPFWTLYSVINEPFNCKVSHTHNRRRASSKGAE